MVMMGDFVRLHYEKKVVHKMMYLDYDVMEREQVLGGNMWKAVRNGKQDIDREKCPLRRISIYL